MTKQKANTDRLLYGVLDAEQMPTEPRDVASTQTFTTLEAATIHAGDRLKSSSNTSGAMFLYEMRPVRCVLLSTSVESIDLLLKKPTPSQNPVLRPKPTHVKPAAPKKPTTPVATIQKTPVKKMSAARVAGLTVNAKKNPAQTSGEPVKTGRK